MIDIIEKQKKRRKKLKFTIEGFNQIEAIKLGLSTKTILSAFNIENGTTSKNGADGMSNITAS